MTQTLSRTWTTRSHGHPEWIHHVRRVGAANSTTTPNDVSEESGNTGGDIEKGNIGEGSEKVEHKNGSPLKAPPKATTLHERCSQPSPNISIRRSASAVGDDLDVSEPIDRDNSCYAGIKLGQDRSSGSGQVTPSDDGGVAKSKRLP